MLKLRINPLVVNDLKEIRDYIAEDKRVSFQTDYKYAIWKDYVILYKVEKEYVEIHRVINRFLDITRIF